MFHLYMNDDNLMEVVTTQQIQERDYDEARLFKHEFETEEEARRWVDIANSVLSMAGVRATFEIAKLLNG